MKYSNQAGVITMAILVAVAAASLLAGVCFTPLTKFLGLSNGQKTTQKHVEKSESTPMFIKGDDGKMHLLNATKSTVSDMDTNEEPKPTIFQRIKGLGFIWVLLMIAGAFFPATIGAWMHMFNQKVISAGKIAYEDLKGETTKIVQSVDIGLKTFDAAIAAHKTAMDVATEPAVKANHQAIIVALGKAKDAFLNAMSVKQDDSTKVLVSQLQHQ